MANSAVTMVQREGADGITVTAEHKALLDDVALEQGRTIQYQTTLTLTRNCVFMICGRVAAHKCKVSYTPTNECDTAGAVANAVHASVTVKRIPEHPLQ